MKPVRPTSSLARLSAGVLAAAIAGCGYRAPDRPTSEIVAAIRAAHVPTTAMVTDGGGSSEHPGQFFIGARAGVNAGTGEPANDMPFWGVYGRYRVNGPWLVGLAVDQGMFDFEQPGNLIEVNPVGVVDAEIDSTTVTLWGEYEFQPLADDGFARGIRPFAGVGVGVGFLGDDHLSGPTEGGGTFAFDAKGGTEIIPGVVIGLRFEVHENFLIELGARADYHLTELEITDTVSGASADVDDYETYGGYVGFQFRW